MRMYDLIEKKKRGAALSDEEIAYMIQGFTAGDIPDYQMSAMLMAIYFQGMNDEEITTMTTVSYTHLDVYKRQAMYLLVRCKRARSVGRPPVTEK